MTHHFVQFSECFVLYWLTVAWSHCLTRQCLCKKYLILQHVWCYFSVWCLLHVVLNSTIDHKYFYSNAILSSFRCSNGSTLHIHHHSSYGSWLPMIPGSIKMIMLVWVETDHSLLDIQWALWGRLVRNKMTLRWSVLLLLQSLIKSIHLDKTRWEWFTGYLWIGTELW